jgi:hypothetical protein
MKQRHERTDCLVARSREDVSGKEERDECDPRDRWTFHTHTSTMSLTQMSAPCHP